jgi:hypothetical protein
MVRALRGFERRWAPQEGGGLGSIAQASSEILTRLRHAKR